MKKLFLIIIGLCLCTALYADMNTYIIGTVSAGGGCTGGSDGAIGTSTVNNNEYADCSTVAYWSEFTPTEDGTVTYGHAIVSLLAATTTINVAIWDSSGNLLVDGTATAGVSEDNHQFNIAFDSEYCLVSGTTYRVGYVINGTDNDLFIDYQTSGTIYYDADATGGDTVSDVTSDGTLSANTITVWCDNSAS